MRPAQARQLRRSRANGTRSAMPFVIFCRREDHFRIGIQLRTLPIRSPMYAMLAAECKRLSL